MFGEFVIINLILVLFKLFELSLYAKKKKNSKSLCSEKFKFNYFAIYIIYCLTNIINVKIIIFIKIQAEI